MDRALIVMAKEPSPGGTKTRLSPPLTAQEAADLYRCFLLDTLDLMRHVDSAQPLIAYAPPESWSSQPYCITFTKEPQVADPDRADYVSIAA